ncbi:MAG: Clp1/GlmU family protein [bacterium]|nr:Clp1/GlmU family protein [bacterium]
MKLWSKVADLVVDRPGLVFLLGGPDTGKTTLATVLANHLLAAGIPVAIVDGDMGQSDIGPPGTVGLGIPDVPFQRLSELPLRAAYFVGSNSPEGHSLSVLVGCSRMIGQARSLGARAIILDTTGLVHGRAARVLKHFKLELLQPDYIVVLQKENELEHLLKHLPDQARVIRVKASPRSQIRSRHQRKLLRERAFRASLAGGRLHEFGLDQVSLCGTIYRTGRALDASEYPGLSQRLGCPVVHAEWIPEGMYLVLEGSYEQARMDRLKEQEGVDQVLTSRADRFRDLLVGLTGGEREWLDIGVLTEVDFASARARVYTRADGELVRAIEVGVLRVSPSGEEMGKIFPNDI